MPKEELENLRKRVAELKEKESECRALFSLHLGKLTPNKVQREWDRLARYCHPDKAGVYAQQRMDIVNEARDVLLELCEKEGRLEKNEAMSVGTHGTHSK
jgi:hypothetical protein